MRRLFQQPWVWALLGTFLLWIILSAGAGQVSLGSLSGILASAAVLCVVAIGQMLVVTTGNGAVDLSIPNVMTLSGFLATGVINGQDNQLSADWRWSFSLEARSAFSTR
jgi:ribose transport system permease protein